MTVCTCGRDLERRLVGGLVVYRHVAGWQVLGDHRIEPVGTPSSAKQAALPDPGPVPASSSPVHEPGLEPAR